MAKTLPGRKNKRALVTGATGYIGYHLVKRLLKDGWRVHALVPEFDDPPKLKRLSGRLTLHWYDGKTRTVLSILRRVRPETVYHLAAKVCVDHRPDEIEAIIAANVLLGTQLLEGMAQLGIRDFINTGSFWQHYKAKVYDPVNFYAATKQAFEDILRFYTETGKIRAVTLKLFDVYGPDDPRNKIMSLFVRHSQSAEPLVMSLGMQKMDLVYIDDAVEAFCHAASLLKRTNANALESCYAVTSSRHIPLKKVAEIYQRVTRRKLPIRWGGRPYRPREVMVPWKGKPLPGWKPAVDLETGIRKIGGTSL